MKRFVKCTLVAVMAIAVLIPGVAFAEFPEKPITYTIPFNPGGESDVTARLQEPELEKDLGVTVNVTHKPGGGGAVAWSEFQRTAKPDGYSIVGCNIPHIIGQPMIRKDAGYETDGMKVVMWFHFTPNALVVSKDSPYKTLDDFIQFAKKKPFVGTVGAGAVLPFISTDISQMVGSVSQSSVRHINNGDPVEVTFPNRPGQVYPGTVAEIVRASPSAQLNASGSIANYAVGAPPDRWLLRVELDDEELARSLPQGVAGSMAVYTQRGKPVHIISKVVMRINAWMAFLTTP